MKYLSFEETIEPLTEFINKGCSHYTYAMVMKEEDHVVIHERTNEPCYGGLRKYKSTHGEEATQPEHKPNDLKKPFPKGEPVALAFPFDGLGYHTQELVDYVWGKESPWIKGFGSPDDLIRINSKGVLKGLILKNMDIDPTVLVNLCKFTYDYLGDSLDKFDSLRKVGLTQFEALCAVTLDNKISYAPATYPNTYMFPTKANLKAMKEGKANDFTGGTFKNRFDYSRKNIQDIFADKEKGIVFVAELKKTGVKFDGKIKVYAEAVKEVVRKYS